MARWDISTAAGSLEFDTVQGGYSSPVQIDANHFINFWSGSGSDGFVQVFTVNTTTWAVSTAAGSLEFDTSAGQYNSAVKIDTNHFINFWSGAGDDGFTQVFTVNTTTWAVTTAAARLEFDTQQGMDNAAAQIDDNHFINFWEDIDVDGKAQVFTVNTTTWAVTTAAATFEFDTQNALYISTKKIDTNHFLTLWQGGSDPHFRGQVFTVNTTTWAITTTSAPLEIDQTNNSGGFSGYRNIVQVDTNHFLIGWKEADEDGVVRVLEIDTSTWEIYQVGTSAFLHDSLLSEEKAFVKIDTNHYIAFWVSDGFDGFTQVLTVDLNYSPTVALNTTDATETSDTTPTLDFTGTDSESNDIRYNIEIDDANDFGYLTPAFDLKSQGVGSGVASLNVAHTITGTNPLLVVVVHKDTTDAVTAVKWGGSGGTDLTFIDKQDHPEGTNVANVEMWYLKAPATGTANIYVSFAGSVDFTVTGLSFTNMDQTAPLDASAKAYGPASAPATPIVDISIITANALIVDGGALNDTGVAMTPGASQTERSDFDGDWNRSFTSTKQATTPKAYKMTWADVGATQWVLMAAAFKPYGSPLLNKVSGTDSGFANPDTGGDTDPFNAGENIQFTVQGGDVLSAGTYYWRVRGIDPSGSGLYGVWSSVRSIIVSSGSSFSQTCDEIVSLVDSLFKGDSSLRSESFSIVDSVLKGTSVTKSESFSIVDSLIKGCSSVMVEIVSIVDSVVLSITNRTLSEIITIVDSKLNDVSRILSEVITLVDSVLKIGNRIFSEVVLIGDIILNTGGKILSEAITVVGSMGGMAITKVLNEVVSIVDLVIRASDRVFNEVISIVDSIVKGREKVLEEIITVVDSIVNVIARELSEIISIVDSLLKTPVKTFSEVFTLVDEFTGKIIGRVFEESIVLVDSLIKVSSRVFSEVVSIVDSVLKTSSRVFSETIVLVDEIVRIVSKVLSEVFSIVDSVLRDISRVFSESYSIVDVLLKTSLRIFSEVFIIADVVLNTTGKILSETLSLADTFLREISKLLIENVVIVDVIVRASSRVFSEVISLVDRFLSLTSRTFTEIISIVDSFFGNPGKEMVEVISIVDSIVKSTGHILSESISVTDSIVREIGKIIGETFSLADTMIKARSVMLSDEISIVDSLLKISGKVLSESVSLVDSVLYFTGKFFVESISVTDKLFRGFRWYQRLSTAFKSALRTGWYDRNNTSAMAKRRTGWYDKNNTDWQD